jgi:8-oxo-dGTP pyrophosphatase MutT (NUDIX family)
MKIDIHNKIDKSWYIKPKDKNLKVREGAGGVIVRKENRKVLVCLVRNEVWKDYILPKGGKEGDETFLETAKREIEEETGLNNIKLVAKLGVKERLTFKKDYWSKMHYFLFVTNQIEGVATDPLENYKPEWFDIDNLPTIFWLEQKELIEENRERIIKLLNKY